MPGLGVWILSVASLLLMALATVAVLNQLIVVAVTIWSLAVASLAWAFVLRKRHAVFASKAWGHLARAWVLLAVRSSQDGLFHWRPGMSEVLISPQGCALLGVPLSPAAASRAQADVDWMQHVHRDDLPSLEQLVRGIAVGRIPSFETTFRVMLPSLEVRWLEARALAHNDERGRLLEVAGWLSDVTERRTNEDRLRHEALHDELTGLPNRAHILHELNHAIARRRHDRNHHYAVLFLDLDRFKWVNDSLGHQAGDELLREFAHRLADRVRNDGIVSRMSGDEFLILLQRSGDSDTIRRDAIALADDIGSRLARALRVLNRELDMTTSVGIVIGNASYLTADEVVRDADTAMYVAKAEAGGQWRVFDPPMREHALQRLDLERDLREAIAEMRFVLHYQPIIEMETRRVVGVESLIRMQHPTRGLVSPGDFIPLAEETGLIVAMTDWALTQATQDLAELRASHPRFASLWVNVNASSRCLEHPEFLESSLALLRTAGLPACALRMEITESVLIHGTGHIESTMRALMDAGIALVLDDFGTGYSSLAYLHRFPFKGIKVDRSFVARLEESSSRALVSTILTLARHLDLTVTAEGIETDEQFNALHDMQCPLAQGYAIARPMPLEVLRSWLETADAAPIQHPDHV